MFNNLGLLVLNGRTASDRVGEFKFLGPTGNSVIDLAAVSVNCLHLVNDFSVLSHAGTDHMPIEVSV